MSGFFYALGALYGIGFGADAIFRGDWTWALSLCGLGLYCGLQALKHARSSL